MIEPLSSVHRTVNVGHFCAVACESDCRVRPPVQGLRPLQAGHSTESLGGSRHEAFESLPGPSVVRPRAGCVPLRGGPLLLAVGGWVGITQHDPSCRLLHRGCRHGLGSSPSRALNGDGAEPRESGAERREGGAKRAHEDQRRGSCRWCGSRRSGKTEGPGEPRRTGESLRRDGEVGQHLHLGDGPVRVEVAGGDAREEVHVVGTWGHRQAQGSWSLDGRSFFGLSRSSGSRCSRGWQGG